MTAFYLPDSSDPGLFHPTELTRGPWSPDAQHGGAPSALLGYVIEQCRPRPECRVGTGHGGISRAGADRAVAGRSTSHPGRGASRPARAQCRIDRGHTEFGPRPGAEGRRLADSTGGAGTRRARPRCCRTGTRPGPDTATPSPDHSFPSTQPVGFHTGVEYRFISGAFQTPGPAVCWIRLRYPVVAGTSLSPLQRTLAAADFANGVSSVLPWARYFFINTDLTVALHRDLVGEWICLDAVTHPEHSGIGLAESRLFDQSGPIGRGTQTLMLGTR